MLTCHEGEIVLGEEDDDRKVGGKGDMVKVGSHEDIAQSVPSPSLTPPHRDLHADQETRFLIPDVVHPINCANKTFTHDQTNGSPTTADHDDDVGRLWNISLVLECEQNRLFSPKDPIWLMFSLFVSFLLRPSYPLLLIPVT